VAEPDAVQRNTANRRRGSTAERAVARVADYGDPRMNEHFWSKVYPCPITGCWLWGDRPSGQGYGQYRWGRRRPVAHRFLWETLFGPVPPGLQLDHLCRVRCCVNPAHLEPVTPQVNNLRGIGPSARYAARTHCDKGHEFTPDNTYRRRSGGRECATCTADRMRRKRQAAGKSPGPAAINATKTHCIRGHALEGDNIRVANRRRVCRTCERERMRRVRAQARAS